MLNMMFSAIIIGLSIFSHELGHYLAYIKHGANPKFGFCFLNKNWLSFTPFVVPLSGSTFYFDYYMKDEKNAWKKEIILSGSGLGVSFVLGIILFGYWLNIIFVYQAILISLPVLLGSIVNFVLFYLNFKDECSDGWRICRALEHKENYVKFLKETNYSFDANNENLKKAIKKIQKKT